MTCVTNTIYNPNSKISSAWILLVRKEVITRELQGYLMCSSSLFLISVVAPVFYYDGCSGTV
jgi:hypothetical protein